MPVVTWHPWQRSTPTGIEPVTSLACSASQAQLEAPSRGLGTTPIPPRKARISVYGDRSRCGNCLRIRRSIFPVSFGSPGDCLAGTRKTKVAHVAARAPQEGSKAAVRRKQRNETAVDPSHPPSQRSHADQPEASTAEQHPFLPPPHSSCVNPSQRLIGKQVAAPSALRAGKALEGFGAYVAKRSGWVGLAGRRLLEILRTLTPRATPLPCEEAVTSGGLGRRWGLP
jgi:hypothetical protein